MKKILPPAYKTFFIICLLLGSLGINPLCQANLSNEQTSIRFDPPTPPQQPPTGPGGLNYTHAGIKESRYLWGNYQFWIFEPTDPTPASAPLIVFNHGYNAIKPYFYQAWIDHLVKRGNIVVFPRYQLGLIAGIPHATQHAILSTKLAIFILTYGNHVRPELDHFAIVGHSLGGGITAEMAALAETNHLPTPRAVMPVQPFINNYTMMENFHNISSDVFLLVVVGEDDTVVGNASGKTIFLTADQIPLENKDFVIQRTDRYGTPALIADHLAPVCIINSTLVNAMDYYSTWKLFDALTDYAFYGQNQQYCLGNTPEQRFMGNWSDGTAVKELTVTDTP